MHRPTTGSSPFVGRERELATLLAAWKHVTAGRGPRTVTVLAESGLGKTRLAQALYEALAADGAATLEGERGYWPTLLGRDGNNLRVNPSLDACAPAAPMPFLWWGIRLVDPLAPNRLAGGVLPSSVERDLLPHLEPLHREARRRERRTRVAKMTAGLLGDAVVDAVPFASLLKTLVSTGLELKGIHDEGRRDGSGRDPSAAAEARALTFLDRVVGDLGALLRPGVVPAVVLVDDGQFSNHDPGVVALVQRLRETAVDEGWPLLLLITHWEQEWRAAKPGSVAAALLGDGSTGERGRVEELRLTPVPDLAPWLRAELPGLTEAQAAALLVRAGGNPRYLDEILRFAAGVRGRGLFEGRDPTRALTDAGLNELMARSVALHELIADRLAASPDAVQQAVVLAALQGPEVLDGLVPGAAEALGVEGPEVGAALADAAERHAYLARIGDASSAFAQRIYLEVARDHLSAWFDAEEATAALAAALRAVVADGRADDLDDADRARLASLIVATFEDHEGVFERRMVVAAFAQLLRPALHRLDVPALEVLTPRFRAALVVLADADLDPDLAWLALALDASRALREQDAIGEVLERFVRLTQDTHDDHVSTWGAAMLAWARVALGDHVAAGGDARAAIEHYAAGNAALGDLADQPFDEDALLAFRLVTDRIGWVLLDAGRLDDAEDRFRTVLSIVDQLVAIDADYERLRTEPLKRLGACAFRRGDNAGAVAWFDQARTLEAVTLGPDAALGTRMAHVETLLALSEGLAATGDRAAALAWARAAHDLAAAGARESVSSTVAELAADAAAQVAALGGGVA
jgi:tetratricopeptide (TPR) repeat protein